MIDEIQKLLDQYLAWLKDKTTLRQVKDWIEITYRYMPRGKIMAFCLLMTVTLLEIYVVPGANWKAKNAEIFLRLP